MSDIQLKEKSVHGTPFFPLHVYTKQSENNRYFVGYHWHEEMELIYVEEGVMQITIHSEVKEVSEGNFAFIHSEELHEVRSSGPSIHHAIVFHPKMLNFEFFDTCQHTIIGPFTKGNLRFPASGDFDRETKEFLADKLKTIIALNRSNSQPASLSIKIILLQIIEYFHRKKLFVQAETKSIEKQQNMKTVMEYIQEHYSERISLDDLASILHMNKNYFCKYFKSALGKTPVTYINEYRCEKAAELLHNTDLKIIDISSMAGFDNVSYFIRTFREFKQYSPSEYRKKLTPYSEPCSVLR